VREASLRKLMSESAEVLAEHEINQVAGRRGTTRRRRFGFGARATREHADVPRAVWDRPRVHDYRVDLLRGLAVLLGWDVHEVAGHDQLPRYRLRASGTRNGQDVDKYDLVFSHIEAPDEASHQADWKTKVEAIEHIDKHIVGPYWKAANFRSMRILVMPDHPTNISTRKHGYAPSPFAMAGTRVTSVLKGDFNEKNAAASDCTSSTDMN